MDRKTESLKLIALSPDFSSDFGAWINDNWHCYLAFEALALRWLSKHQHCGAKMIWETLRFQTGISEKEVTFKLNNNYTADLARLFEQLHPEHAGAFEKRERRKAAA